MKKENKGRYLIIGILLAIIIVIFLVYSSLNNKQFQITNDYSEIKIGENIKINYNVDDSVKSIVWISSDESVAHVDQDGIITGLGYGMSIITGKALFNKKEISRNIIVLVYSGDKNVSLNNVEFLDGEILMGINGQFAMPYTIVPSNSYITSIKYDVVNSNIIEIQDNVIIAKNLGDTSFKISVNDTYSKVFQVHVVDKNVASKMIKKVESIAFSDDEINLKVNDNKKIDYVVNPSDAYVEKITWQSSDDSIVGVNDGVITAKKTGKASIYIIINDTIKAEINVNVLKEASGIQIDYYPKKLLRIGESSKIIAKVIPDDASDKEITYKSSNTSVVDVNNGIITAKSNGNATITLSTNNNKTEKVEINVLPLKGVIGGTGNLWGYHSLNEKTPVRADINFFSQLARSGKGVLSGNTYTYTNSSVKYTYEIDKSLLNANGKKIMARFYYPLNTDLSSLNMFTFMGGDGENNFSMFFNNVEKDKSLIKSAGTVVLVAEGSRYNTSFDQESGFYATSFAKIIFNQKSSAKTSIGGFSTGGTKVMGAANMGNYDRVVIFSSYYNWSTSATNLKNKEIMIYIPNGDHLYQQAKETLRDMKKAGYTNVTVVTNSNEIDSLYGNDFLIINPGTLMINSHVTENVTRSGVFSYANE